MEQVSYYLEINIEKTKERNFAFDLKNKINEIIEKLIVKNAKPCETNGGRTPGIRQPKNNTIG